MVALAIHWPLLTSEDYQLYDETAKENLERETGFEPAWLAPVVWKTTELPDCSSPAQNRPVKMAGAEGFEPPSLVLETSSLAAELTPL